MTAKSIICCALYHIAEGAIAYSLLFAAYMQRKIYVKKVPYGGFLAMTILIYMAQLQMVKAQAAAFRWTGTGNGRTWTDPANWQQEIEGRWQAAIRYPGMDEDEVSIQIEEDDELTIIGLPFVPINGKPIFFLSRLSILSGTITLADDDDTPANAQFLIGPPLKSQVLPGFQAGRDGPDISIFPADNPTLEVKPTAKLIVSAALSSHQWRVPNFAQFVIGGLLYIR